MSSFQSAFLDHVYDDANDDAATDDDDFEDDEYEEDDDHRDNSHMSHVLLFPHRGKCSCRTTAWPGSSSASARRSTGWRWSRSATATRRCWTRQRTSWRSAARSPTFSATSPWRPPSLSPPRSSTWDWPRWTSTHGASRCAKVSTPPPFDLQRSPFERILSPVGTRAAFGGRVYIPLCLCVMVRLEEHAEFIRCVLAHACSRQSLARHTLSHGF